MEQIKAIGGRAVYPQPTTPPKPVTDDSPSKVSNNASPQFVSPKGSIDPQSGVFVTEVRDTGTGKVSFQYPSKKAVAAYTSQQPKTEEGQQQSNTNEGKAESSEKAKPSTVEDAVTGGTEEQG